jgi:hypothetical protein
MLSIWGALLVFMTLFSIFHGTRDDYAFDLVRSPRSLDFPPHVRLFTRSIWSALVFMPLSISHGTCDDLCFRSLALSALS